VAVDFQRLLAEQGFNGTFDHHTVEVTAVSRRTNGSLMRVAVPHRIDRFFGVTGVKLHFVMPDNHRTNYAVYFDTVESGRGKPRRYPGLIGDGDLFHEDFQRRELSASHFDQFVDFDGDGDLDLIKGGVEPFVYCFENAGGNRFVDRGRLTSRGEVFKLPCSKANRSWVTVTLFDIDSDGRMDFFPSFGDGPDAGQIIFYRNTTREHGGQLTYDRIGPLQTKSGLPLAGGAQAGGWFPSIAFVGDWDGDGLGPDALVGSNHRCWLYRGLSIRPFRADQKQSAPVFAEAIAVQAGGKDIELINPRFDAADIDRDGDLDLFAGTQPGAVHWFKNIGTGARTELVPGGVVAWTGNYLIGDAHSGVKIADFDSDGLLDVASGRFWERTDLNAPDKPRDFGGFFKNVGRGTSPRFKRQTRGAPFTEQFQMCDAIRQNCVRATDWDGDGDTDLLAGDTDGFVWFFRNLSRSSRKQAQQTPLEPRTSWSVFAAGEKLRAANQPLTVAGTGGHARFDVRDWNNDGQKDLIVADGSGTLTLFLNRGGRSKPSLTAGQRLIAAGQPIQLSGRASVLVCDWDNDRCKDLILADDKGYYFSRNTGADAAPVLASPKPVHFGGKRVTYIRPNLGSFVDWDGDGKHDLIGCHFENSIRFYRNISSGAPGTEPQFADPEGVTILQGESPQMISGANVIDWNGDGDLDLLTGQGHGGSGLRFYERDWIEDEIHNTHPVVTTGRLEMKPN
jgi:hypothetical protein